MLFVPWFGAAFILAYWYGLQFFPNWKNHYDLLLLVCGMVFLDGIHITYTFILILGVPELKKWARDGGPAMAARFAAVAVGLFVTFYFLRFSPVTKHITMIFFLYNFIEAVGPSQHTLAQMRGISFCYHSVIRKSGMIDKKQAEEATQIEKREKKYFRYLLAADTIASLPFILYASKINYPDLYLVRQFGLIFALVAAFLLLVNANLFPRQKSTRKMLFLSRVLLIPMKAVIPATGLVIRACHGTEYLVILRQMTKNSGANEARKRKVLVATFYISLFFCIPYVFGFRGTLKKEFNIFEPVQVYYWFLMFQLMVRYLHYYMDSVLYKMSEARTRTVVGPLLVRPPAPVETRTAPNAIAV